MSRTRHALQLSFFALCLALWQPGAVQAQQIGDPIGAISFKQDANGVVNGFLIENLSDLLPESLPANVQFAHLSLTVGATTTFFDTALGSPLVLTPGTAADTTEPAFPLDNVVQFAADSAPTSAILRGDLLNSSGTPLSLTLLATLSASDLTVPQNPGDVNAPVTIRVAGGNVVPGPNALVLVFGGQGAGTVALLLRRKARQRTAAA